MSGIPTSVGAPEGRYPFTISTGAGCTWNARTDVTWADVTPGNGIGSATPMLNVNENQNRDTRTITVTASGQTFRIIQQVPNCSYSVQPTTLDLGGLSGGVFIALTTGNQCPWSASASESWIRAVRSSGAGSDDVEFQFETNSSSPRTAVLTVAGIRVSVVQQRKP